MTNLMSHHPKSIDVHVMVNGRKATVQSGKGIVRFKFTSGQNKETIVALARQQIQCVALGSGKAGLQLAKPHVIVPNTKRPVTSVILSRSCADVSDAWQNVAEYLSTEMHAIDCSTGVQLTTTCERYTVHLLSGQVTNTVVAWQKNKCFIVQDVKAAILQRTTGGMKTYDAHIIPTSGPIVTVEMLPHSTMGEWNRLFGDEQVVDAGADPLHSSYVEHAQTVPSVKDFVARVLEQDSSASSDEASEWDGSSSSSSSSGDELSCISSCSESDMSEDD